MNFNRPARTNDLTWLIVLIIVSVVIQRLARTSRERSIAAGSSGFGDEPAQCALVVPESVTFLEQAPAEAGSKDQNEEVRWLHTQR